MFFEPAARGRPHSPLEAEPDPTTEIRDLLERMHDSIVGLQKAAALVSDDSLTRYLAGMAERREDTLQAVSADAADAGIEPIADPSGTAVEMLRRGWMHLEASVDGDEQVVGTVIDQEQSMLEAIEDVLTLDLPTGVARRLRTIAGELGSDLTGLSEWQSTEDGDR